jgi:hypothetical protein
VRWGDPKLALFITTSRERREPGDEPLAGSPFHATVGIEGLSAREYTG